MNIVQKVVKNSILLFALKISQYVFLFVFTVYAARYLGVERFGKLTFALSFTALFLLVSDFGLSRLITREIAGKNSEINLIGSNGLLLKIPLSIISFLLIVIIINLMGYPQDTTYMVYILGVSIVLYSYAIFFSGIFRGWEKMEYEFISMFWEKPILLILGLWFIHKGMGLISLSYVFLISRFVVFAIGLFIYNKIKPIRIKFDLDFCKRLFKKSMPFGLFVIFGTLYFQIDTVILSYIKGDEAVGIYQAVVRLIIILMIIPEAFTESLFPRMTKYFYTSKEHLDLIYKKAFKVLLITGLPITAILLILSQKIIFFIFGESFSKSAGILQILSVVIIFRFLAYVPGTLLTAIEKQKIRMRITGLSCLINILLNLLLIPHFSFWGAAIANLLTHVFLFSSYMTIVGLRGYGKINVQDLVKPFISLILMIISLYYFRNLSLLIIIPISIALYFSVLYFIKGISREERDILRTLFAFSK